MRDVITPFHKAETRRNSGSVYSICWTHCRKFLHSIGLSLASKTIKSVDILFLFLNEVQLIYNLVFIPAVQQSDSVIYIYNVCIYIYTLFFIFFSVWLFIRLLSIAPCAVQWALVLIRSLHNTLHPLILIYPSPRPPLGSHESVLYVFKPVSVLQLSSFVPYFRFRI